MAVETASANEGASRSKSKYTTPSRVPKRASLHPASKSLFSNLLVRLDNSDRIRVKLCVSCLPGFLLVRILSSLLMRALIHALANAGRMVLRVLGGRPNRKLASTPLSKRAEKSAPSMTCRTSPSPPAKLRISNGGLDFLVRVPGPYHKRKSTGPC